MDGFISWAPRTRGHSCQPPDKLFRGAQRLYRVYRPRPECGHNRAAKFCIDTFGIVPRIVPGESAEAEGQDTCVREQRRKRATKRIMKCSMNDPPVESKGPVV